MKIKNKKLKLLVIVLILFLCSLFINIRNSFGIYKSNLSTPINLTVLDFLANYVITFDLTIPGSLCDNCYQEGYLFSKNTLKLLNLFLDIDISKIDKLSITSPKTLEELHFFLKEYYDSYTGIYFN